MVSLVGLVTPCLVVPGLMGSRLVDDLLRLYVADLP